MRVLLIGEYSNVHATLAEGLRLLGHQVTVVSNGDFWKDYPRDIDLSRREGALGGALYMVQLYFLLPKLCGYDVVQLINPMFLELKAERIFHIYRYLRRHNKRVILCGFGMDYYWVHTCCQDKPLRYSDFNLGKELRTNEDALKERQDWIGTAKERLNRLIAEDCDAIVTGLYEYWRCYQPTFPYKTTFIPFPIKVKSEITVSEEFKGKVKIFIGINKKRSEYKGTDILLRIAQELSVVHADQMELRLAMNVPFRQYVTMMNGSDAIIDQLYSYTPAMNALEAMANGVICIGGGEPENYEILHEEELRPIVNVTPHEKQIYHTLEEFILHPEQIPSLKRQSIEYVKRHHDYISVARQYEELYNNILSRYQ